MPVESTGRYSRPDGGGSGRASTARRRNDWVDAEVGYGLIEERDRYQVRDLAAGYRTSTLIYHGLADDVVPDVDSLEFLRRVDCPDVELRLLKAGDHRLTAHKDEIAAAAGAFFAERISSVDLFW